jgi:hypothetical protein
MLFRYNEGMNGRKTRMVFVIGLFFLSLVAAKGEEKKDDKKDEPKLLCPVDNPLNPDKKREASPREAGRIASSLWRDVKGQSNNQDMSHTWISRFASCLQVSGLSLGVVAPETTYFRHSALRTLLATAEDIRKNAETLDVPEELKTFDEQVKAAKALTPALTTEVTDRDLHFDKAERDDLLGRHAGAEKKLRESCSPKDFSSRLGMVRNQTDIGWCYAFSAADLVTFKMGPSTNNFTRKISAADLAFQYNRENYKERAETYGVNNADQEGGWMAAALKSALKHGGYCPEKDAPSEDLAYGLLKETVAEVEGFKVEAQYNELPDDRFCLAYGRTRELFPNLGVKDFQDILTVIGDRNLDFFEKLDDKNCKDKRNAYGVTEKSVHELNSKNSDEKGFLNAIDEQLDKNNVSAIGIQFSMLSAKGASGLHAVNVVGRRYNEEKKSCEYLLRNSWGLGCSKSLKQDLCAKEHSGHLWVSRDTLKDGLVNVTYIE